MITLVETLLDGLVEKSVDSIDPTPKNYSICSDFASMVYFAPQPPSPHEHQYLLVIEHSRRDALRFQVSVIQLVSRSRGDFLKFLMLTANGPVVLPDTCRDEWPKLFVVTLNIAFSAILGHCTPVIQVSAVG